MKVIVSGLLNNNSSARSKFIFPVYIALLLGWLFVLSACTPDPVDAVEIDCPEELSAHWDNGKGLRISFFKNGNILDWPNPIESKNDYEFKFETYSCSQSGSTLFLTTTGDRRFGEHISLHFTYQIDNLSDDELTISHVDPKVKYSNLDQEQTEEYIDTMNNLVGKKYRFSAIKVIDCPDELYGTWEGYPETTIEFHVSGISDWTLGPIGKSRHFLCTKTKNTLHLKVYYSEGDNTGIGDSVIYALISKIDQLSQEKLILTFEDGEIIDSGWSFDQPEFEKKLNEMIGEEFIYNRIE